MYLNKNVLELPHNAMTFIFKLGAIFILRKDIGVGGWSRKWQFSLTLCSENVLTKVGGWFKKASKHL